MLNQDEIHALRNAWRLSGPDWNRRIQAANLLGDVRAAEAVPALEAVAIENKHPELVKAAIRSLGQMQNETALMAVGQVLECTSAEAPVTQCLEYLLPALKNGSPAARRAITVQCDRCFPILINRARQGDKAAGQAILQMGEPGIHKLMDALLEPDMRVIATSLLRSLENQA